MNFSTLRRIVKDKPKGTFANIIWEKQLPVRKTFPNTVVTKRTQGTVRVGVTYDNMQVVQLKRADGTLPQANAGLTWGEWSEYPYFISHKDKKYLRVALDRNNKMNSIYFINGVQATREQAEPYCTKAAFPQAEERPDVFSICVDNIIAIR